MDGFHDVRVAELDGRMIALAQSPREEFPVIAGRLLQMEPAVPFVLHQPAHTVDELRIALVHGFDLVQHVRSPRLAPVLGLSAVVAAAAGRVRGGSALPRPRWWPTTSSG